jgi:hypothetical protein
MTLPTSTTKPIESARIDEPLAEYVGTMLRNPQKPTQKTLSLYHIFTLLSILTGVLLSLISAKISRLILPLIF